MIVDIIYRNVERQLYKKMKDIEFYKIRNMFLYIHAHMLAAKIPCKTKALQNLKDGLM